MQFDVGSRSSGSGNSGGPFDPYFANARFGVSSGKVRGLATSTTAHNTRLKGVLTDLDVSRRQIGGLIEGQAANDTGAQTDPAKGKVSKTVRRGIIFEAAMTQLADHIDAHDATIRGLASRYPKAKPDKARTEATPVNNRLEKQAEQTSQLLDGDPHGDGPLIKNLILNGYISLTDAKNWPGIEASLTDAQRRTAEGHHFKLMTPDEQVAYIKGHKDIDFDVASVISPTAARTLAEDTATDVENKKVDEETARILGLLATDSTFANAFYTQVDPYEMADAIKHLNDTTFPEPDEDDEGKTVDVSLYDDFMNAAGVALATHTRYCGAVDTYASNLAKTWADAIKDPDHPENAAALTLLIREGGEQRNGEFSPEFISQLTKDICAWEKETPGVWSDRAEEAGAIYDPDSTVTTAIHYTEVGAEWAGGAPPSTVEYSGGRLATDGLANLLAGMGNSPEGARAFFTSSSGDVDQDLLTYVLTDRPYTSNSDGGDGLGEALHAATVGEGADKRSVSIIESVVATTYDAIPTGNNKGTFSQEDILPPEARDSVADAIGHYMPSVYTAMGVNPTALVNNDGSVFDDARFNVHGEGQLPTQLILAELAKDDEGREILTGYANAQALLELDQSLQGVQDVDDVERRVTGNSLLAAEVLGAIDFGAKSAAAEAQLSADESYNQEVDDSVSAAKSLLGATPIGKVPLSGLIMDELGKAIAEASHVDHRAQLNADHGRIFSNNGTDFANLVRDTIWRNLPHHPGGMDGSEDLDNLSPDDKRAYDHWYANNPWGQELKSRTAQAEQAYGTNITASQDALEPYGR